MQQQEMSNNYRKTQYSISIIVFDIQYLVLVLKVHHSTANNKKTSPNAGNAAMHRQQSIFPKQKQKQQQKQQNNALSL